MTLNCARINHRWPCMGSHACLEIGKDDTTTGPKRVAAGVMDFPEEIDAVLREIRAMAPKSG